MNVEQLSVAAVSDTGNKRPTNQDCGYAEYGIYVVCDGMGGYQGGERASASVVKHLSELAKVPHRTREDIDRLLGEAQVECLQIGQELHSVAGSTLTGVILRDVPREHRPGRHAGTGEVGTVGEAGTPSESQSSAAAEDKPSTLDFDAIHSTEIDHITSMLNLNTRTLMAGESTEVSREPGENRQFLPNALLADEPAPCYVVNVGDSRTYHMDFGADGKPDALSLTQITHDHSRRQQAIDNGEMPEEIAKSIIPRNIITQCVGDPNGFSADMYVADACGRFIVCSDGLHGEVDDDTIAHIASEHTSADGAAQALLQAALQSGGKDNITIIVVDMPSESEGHTWKYERLGEREDIGMIQDDTLQTQASSRRA